MIQNLPNYIAITFALTTITTLLLFTNAIKNATHPQTQKKANTIFTILLTWLIIQALFALKNVYNTNTDTFPPKILLLGILPPIVTTIILFSTAKGRQFIDALPLKNLTYLNIVRIPVEIVLYWLFLNKTIPELMTFEGRNFDIIVGLTAPFIAYFGFTKPQIGRNTILLWNCISLALLINIVIHALLSAPSPIQRLAFEQPNRAILNFPFSWLPTFIVPIILLGHLISIRRLIKSPKTIE